MAACHRPHGKAHSVAVSRRAGTHSRRGVTLVEMLVAIAVIAILLAILVPAVLRVRESANRATCANNLGQLGMAALHFNDANRRLPPAFGFMPTVNIYNGGSALGPLFFHLLPFVEQQNLYESARYRPTSRPQQDFLLYTAGAVSKTPLPLFTCPSDPTIPSGGVNPATGYATGCYAANYLVFGNVNAVYVSSNAQGNAKIPDAFPDGASATILFAEKYAVSELPAAFSPDGKTYRGGCHWDYFQGDCNNPFVAYTINRPKWIAPNAIGPVNRTDPRDSRFQVQPPPKRCNPCLASTAHQTMNTGMADGSVRALTAEVSRAVWWALLTPAGHDMAD